MKSNKAIIYCKNYLLYFMIPVFTVLIWEVLFRIGAISALLLPPPSQNLKTFFYLLSDGSLWRNLSISIVRVLEGFTLAAITGIFLGICIGLSKKIDKLTDFLIQILKPIPPIAWIPLAILWFGIGETSKIFIIFLGAFFPIVINVTDSIRHTDFKFVELSKSFEVPKWKFILFIIIPGALPSILTGLRVGLGVAWMCVVAAELIAASEGIGYLIMDARQLAQSDVIIIGMFIIGLIGNLMDFFLKKLEKILIRWKTSYKGE